MKRKNKKPKAPTHKSVYTTCPLCLGTKEENVPYYQSDGSCSHLYTLSHVIRCTNCKGKGYIDTGMFILA